MVEWGFPCWKWGCVVCDGRCGEVASVVALLFVLASVDPEDVCVEKLRWLVLEARGFVRGGGGEVAFSEWLLSLDLP